ncbi:DUF421 domain-containing protein [Alienimonas californiensis]|uniref:YetF C-terminal domain-containing protein n=1 Tax=Alienimonas californiensis TaxID=2527989 RepID=A0A517P4M9_9PLAN|nr:YetF domain-containing protein [Alienimonas californiensis]QDT14323.1 hypothetical protein CA12_03950 [Alienimonas californiensis]
MDELLHDFVPKALFKGWPTLFRVAVSGVALYVAVLIMFRLQGTRTTSKMNNFDWIVTIASGSIFGSAVVSDTVTVTQALVAFAVLMLCQWIVTKLSAIFPAFYDLVAASPALLFRNGRFLDDKLVSERVTKDEILAAVRSAGVTNLEGVSAVVLEADGTLTVLSGRGVDSPELMRPVKYVSPAPEGGNPA